MSGGNGKSVVVIGAGPGGYAAAFHANDLGLNVTLVDTEPNPGGVCLYRGCIPSKALLHVARIINEAADAEYWGVKFSKPKIDVERLRRSKNDVVQKMTGGLGQLCKARKIKFVQGRASFEDSRTVRVTSDTGEEQRLNPDYTILAAGSRPATLPDLYLESDRLLNSTTALEVEEVPRTLLVIGGGYIGLELGSVYATLGSKVTVVEMTDGLLPGADRELVAILKRRLDEQMAAILLNTKVVELVEKRDGVQVTLESQGQKPVKKTFEKVLISVGRKPNSSGIGLNHTKVVVNAKGFVEVDDHRRTSDPSIFAIGDIAGEPMLAHKASHEGRVAAEVIAGHKAVFAPRAIPAVVFTDPEVAWCGLSESEAKTLKRDVHVARFPWSASGRATTLNRDDGLTKLITDPESGVLLGMGVVGPNAGELIAQGVVAIEMGATAEDLSLSIHPHPTLSETIMESAELIFGPGTHVFRPKRPVARS